MHFLFPWFSMTSHSKPKAHKIIIKKYYCLFISQVYFFCKILNSLASILSCPLSNSWWATWPGGNDYFVSFQDVILYHYGEAPDDYEKELELFENLRKVCWKNWRTAPPKNCRPTVGQLLADSRPTVGRLSFTAFYENLLPTVGRLSADCWQHVSNLLANYQLRAPVEYQKSLSS